MPTTSHHKNDITSLVGNPYQPLFATGILGHRKLQELQWTIFADCFAKLYIKKIHKSIFNSKYIYISYYMYYIYYIYIIYYIYMYYIRKFICNTNHNVLPLKTFCFFVKWQLPSDFRDLPNLPWKEGLFLSLPRWGNILPVKPRKVWGFTKPIQSMGLVFKNVHFRGVSMGSM